MELEAAARRWALADATITGYVVQKVYKYRMMESLDGTGGAALVLKRDGGWTQPDSVQTAERPTLIAQCWADADRDGDGFMLTGNAEEKAWALYRAVAARFHGVRGQRWGVTADNPGLMVVSCARWAEPIVSFQGNLHAGDPDKTLIAEGAIVTAKFAVQIAVGSYA